MDKRGSITIFFSLILAIVISLMSGLLLSAKISAGRVQIANGVDMSLFSAMAKYDRTLFEEFHLFYIDGGYGTETLQLGKALDEIESDLMYSITPNKDKEWLGGKNFLQIEEVSGSIMGYTLATDCNGSVFLEQVLSYMEDTLSLQGISLLSQSVEDLQKHFSDYEDLHKKIEAKGTVEDYENIKNQIEEMPKAESKEEQKKESKDIDATQADTVAAARAKDVLDSISVLKKHTLLDLVLDDTAGISDWTLCGKESLKRRNLDTGMGYLELYREKETLLDDLLFQEYVMQNINSYTNKPHETGPAYGVERMIFNKDTDIQNLEAMAAQLMLIREGVNVSYLYTDSVRLNEIRTMAASLAAVLGVPGAELILEGAIALAWAYAESIVDVHVLLGGGEVPLVKSRENWQVDFVEIPIAVTDPGAVQKEVKGTSYEDYLRMFLAAKKREERITGCMDVIELTMKEIPGKEYFAMDLAIDSLEVEFVFRVEDYLDFFIREKRSYRML